MLVFGVVGDEYEATLQLVPGGFGCSVPTRERGSVKLFNRKRRDEDIYHHGPIPVVTPRMQAKRSLSHFVFTRIEDMGDVEEAAALREAWNVAHDQINASPSPTQPMFLTGEVKDAPALRELARNWAGHPDFLPEWETP